jgi:hypothetical protein
MVGKTREFFDGSWEVGEAQAGDHEFPFVHEGHELHEDSKDQAFPFKFGVAAKIDENTHLHPRGFEIVEELRFFPAGKTVERFQLNYDLVKIDQIRDVFLLQDMLLFRLTKIG